MEKRKIKHNKAPLIEEWTQRTVWILLCGFFDLDYDSPGSLLVIFPWVDSIKWRLAKLIKVTLSAALQRWMESPRVRLCNRGQDFFSFHYLHLPEAVQSPHRQHNASFHQVSLSRKKADRELLCSMDARSGVEGCRWEAKQKASQAVSVLTDPLAFSGPNGKKKTTIRIKLSFQ